MACMCDKDLYAGNGNHFCSLLACPYLIFVECVRRYAVTEKLVSKGPTKTKLLLYFLTKSMVKEIKQGVLAHKPKGKWDVGMGRNREH